MPFVRGTLFDRSDLAAKVRNFIVKKFAPIFNLQYLPHLSILFLALIVVMTNVNDRRAMWNFYRQFVYTDTTAEYAFAQEIDDFTPLIPNDAASIQKVSLAANTADGFVPNVGSAITEITQREEPLPDNSASTIQYIVKEGDTLTGIGWKFEVKLATLKYINDIDNLDALKPGATLKIPPKNYEVSPALIAKKEREKRAKVALSRQTIARSASSARAAYNSDNSGGGLIVPLAHSGITRGLGRGHTGIDYRANIGTPIVASTAGRVSLADGGGWNGGYGKQIVIDHGGGVLTRYAHLNGIAVSAGEYASQGQLIGYSGNTGRSTGPHLHFEKIVNGRPVNPF
ncbi:MAG: LysM peptidoglycan-binding domain-containing M23 family metallopeptidase [Patescibacteria group bacterium]